MQFIIVKKIDFIIHCLQVRRTDYTLKEVHSSKVNGWQKTTILFFLLLKITQYVLSVKKEKKNTPIYFNTNYRTE